jgi:peptidoglycan hydrolase-like protein with peptidoglycan-binding domain
VQELLIAAGEKLPRWGADGGFGDETEAAVDAFQAKHGLTADGIVGPLTMEALQAATEGKSSSVMTMIDAVEVHDYRGRLPLPKNAKPGFGNRWPKLRGVVLHRTACRLGERPERYFKVNAHMHVTLEGRIILCHPWDMHIWHGHKQSLWALGIEFDGNPLGEEGRWWKPGGGPDSITDAQVKAADVLLNLLLEAFEKRGRPFERVYAHRQGSDQRACDPGIEAWEKIARPWMEKTGATPGGDGWEGSTYGSGLHIPKSWDPRSSVTKFWTK